MKTSTKFKIVAYGGLVLLVGLMLCFLRFTPMEITTLIIMSFCYGMISVHLLNEIDKKVLKIEKWEEENEKERVD